MSNDKKLSDDQLSKVSGGYKEDNLLSDFTGYEIICPRCKNSDKAYMTYVPAPEGSILTGEYICNYKGCGCHFTPSKKAD